MKEPSGAFLRRVEDCMGFFKFLDGREECLCCRLCFLEGRMGVSCSVSGVGVTHVGQRKGIGGLD